MVLLQGILWKWTNYYYGWQPRWFILNDGILSYYKSEEEVNQGCKGSVSLSACDINVHSSDNLRIDIVIPGEKYIYVKAGSTTERTTWLLALKALGHQQDSTTTTNKTRKTSSGDSNGIVSSASDELKTKKSELRLYCDLLVQQVHSIKEAATAENGPNVEKLDENTSLLTATCETFIKTLDECTKITNNFSNSSNSKNHLNLNLNTPLVPQNPNSSRNGTSTSTSTSKANRQVFHSNSTSN